MKFLISFLLFAAIGWGQMRLAQQQPPPAAAVLPAGEQAGRAVAPSESRPDLTVMVNKSIVLDHAAGFRRVSITNPEIAEAVAVSPVELVINGKSAGDTSLILWDRAGARMRYDVHVVANDSKLELVRTELVNEVGPNVAIAVEDGNVFLRGTVADRVLADRAANIAGTLGKVVNLLRVIVGPEPPQILLKVRFATVSRTASTQLGFNFFSGNSKGYANTTTGQFGQAPTGLLGGNGGQGMSLTDLLNVFYFRPDLNIGAVLEALVAKSLAQILAEPNLLTVSGKQASFLAGGEFPFPTIQGGAAGVGQITVSFKEFGIRLNFLPTITPRGTIRCVVTPEVSSLDYSNGLTVSGFTVPGLATRRVTTEIELQNGQSFAIAGLLNNSVTDQLDKIPGLGDIPVLGKLFQSRSLTKTNEELIVLVTPELVAPIPAGVKPPEPSMPIPFLPHGATPMQNPGPAVTGPIAPLPRIQALPVEELPSTETGGAPQPSSNTIPQLLLVQPAQLPSAPAQPQTGSQQNTPLPSH